MGNHKRQHPLLRHKSRCGDHLNYPINSYGCLPNFDAALSKKKQVHPLLTRTVPGPGMPVAVCKRKKGRSKRFPLPDKSGIADCAFDQIEKRGASSEAPR
jgi:hypothetical protein